MSRTTVAEFVDPETGEVQAQLPGDWPEFPPPPPSICEIQTIQGPRPVPAVELTFSGKKLLVASSPEDVLMAQQVGLSDSLWLHVEAQVAKTALAPTKVGIIGQATLQIEQAVRADEAGVLHLRDELERTRTALHRLRNDAGLFLGRFTAAARPHLPTLADDDDSPEARGIRSLFHLADDLRGGIDATKWVPYPKPEES